MKALFVIAALAAGSLPASLGLAQGHATGTQETPAEGGALNSADRKFLNEAALDGLLEVKLGQMATKQATHEDVKKFGQRMVDDHTKVNGELAKLAQPKGVMIPTTLDKKRQDQADKLSKLGGVDFDKNYMSQMVDNHKNYVDNFEKASKDAKDPAVKGFAASNLPTLREHLNAAKDLESRVKQEKKP